MNKIDSTLFKVTELEKRLDNELNKSGLKVTELKRDFSLFTLEDFVEVDMIELSATSGESNVVLNGELRLRVNQATNIRIKLFLDGYEIYNRIASYVVGVHSISIIRAIALSPNVSQKLVLRIEKSGGGAVQLGTYNFFVWGYGEAGIVDSSLLEPKLFADTDGNGNYAVVLVANTVARSFVSSGFPENLDINDFSEYGNFLEVHPKFFLGELYYFEIDTTGELKIKTPSGEVLVASSVSALSVDKIFGEDRLVVVYSVGSDVFYFTFDGATRSESVRLFSFDERIDCVSLVKNSETTTFLVVGLASGKNYLFSSVTKVMAGDNHSFVEVLSSVDFN